MDYKELFESLCSTLTMVSQARRSMFYLFDPEKCEDEKELLDVIDRVVKEHKEKVSNEVAEE